MYSGYMHDAVIGKENLLTIRHGKECWRRAEPGRQAENAGADARSSSLRTSFRQTHQQIGKWNVLNKRGARRTQKLAGKSSRTNTGGRAENVITNLSHYDLLHLHLRSQFLAVHTPVVYVR